MALVTVYLFKTFFQRLFLQIGLQMVSVFNKKRVLGALTDYVFVI